MSIAIKNLSSSIKKDEIKIYSESQLLLKREDLNKTEHFLPDKRRLDTFTRLMCGYSTCVAVIVVNGQFFVTANELHRKNKVERKSQSQGFIENVADYFRNVALGKSSSPEKRKETFKEICVPHRLNEFTKGGTVQIPDELPGEMADKVWEYNGELRLIEFIKSYHGKSVTPFVYSEWLNLYRDFSKLEKSIKRSIDDSTLSPDLTKQQISAFKSKMNVLKEEPSAAELKKKNTKCMLKSKF